MRMDYLALAAGTMLISGGAASAATVANPLHLRAGPSTHYRVVSTMPAGAHVRTRNCTGSWRRMNFRGETGWASANCLGYGRRAYRARYYRARPACRAYAQAPAYYEEGPGVGIGFGPAGFGFGVGPGYRSHHRDRYDYHHGQRP